MATENIELTRDSAKVIAAIYGYYKSLRNKGVSHDEAHRLPQFFWKDHEKLSALDRNDIERCLSELEDAKCIGRNVLGDIILTNIGIIYMENDFKRKFSKVKEVCDFVKSFIPWL